MVVLLDEGAFEQNEKLILLSFSLALEMRMSTSKENR